MNAPTITDCVLTSRVVTIVLVTGGIHFIQMAKHVKVSTGFKKN